jgi:hypothetical protein
MTIERSLRGICLQDIPVKGLLMTVRTMMLLIKVHVVQGLNHPIFQLIIDNDAGK